MGAKLLYRDAQGRDAAVDLPEVGAFLGRAVECIVRTDDALVSRRNCKISVLSGRWYVEDLGSANGTYINERRIQRDGLSHGDVIRCGSLQVRFVEVADAAPQRVTVPPARRSVPGASDRRTVGFVVTEKERTSGCDMPSERLKGHRLGHPLAHALQDLMSQEDLTAAHLGKSRHHDRQGRIDGDWFACTEVPRDSGGLPLDP